MIAEVLSFDHEDRVVFITHPYMKTMDMSQLPFLIVDDAFFIANFSVLFFAALGQGPVIAHLMGMATRPLEDVLLFTYNFS